MTHLDELRTSVIHDLLNRYDQLHAEKAKTKDVRKKIRLAKKLKVVISMLWDCSKAFRLQGEEYQKFITSARQDWMNRIDQIEHLAMDKTLTRGQRRMYRRRADFINDLYSIFFLITCVKYAHTNLRF